MRRVEILVPYGIAAERTTSHSATDQLLPYSVLQATSRLLRSLVGVRKTAPTPSEVVQPAAACRDVYRLLHENIQQLRGSFKHSPISSEVRRVAYHRTGGSGLHNSLCGSS